MWIAYFAKCFKTRQADLSGCEMVHVSVHVVSGKMYVIKVNHVHYMSETDFLNHLYDTSITQHAH